MREVGCVGSPPHVTRLKVERNYLRSVIRRTPADQAGELQLEYAKKCEALGHWYRQESDERRAKGDEKNARYCKISAQGEFEQANKARQDAAQTSDVR